MSWLNAREALQVLKVRPQTLYANVSRKKIRAKADPKDTRRSLYHEADVRKMARQQGGRRKATAVAAETIQWGDPILSSAVSTVVEGKLYYRGRDAVVLAEEMSLEEVAGLLWGVEGSPNAGRDGREGGGASAVGRAGRDGGGAGAIGHAGRDGGGAGAVGRAGRDGGGGGAIGHARQAGGGAVGDQARAVLRPDAEGTLGNGSGAVAHVDFAPSGRAREPALLDVLDARVLHAAPPLHRAFLALGLRAADDFASYGRSLPVLQNDAVSLLITLAGALLGEQPAPRTRDVRAGRRLHRTAARVSDPVRLHERMATAWRRRDATDIIRRALVLLADHELNASTFATRVAVSTGAPLAAGVLSGLATLSGPLHGRASLGVLQLVAGVKRVGADTTVREWLSLSRPISGFGHPLYPLGDPRARALMQQFSLPKEYAELCDIVEREIGEQPNIDFALSALTRVYGLPREAPLILFALGRCVGWLAHALEQVTTGQPIRPRAHYVGPSIS